MVWRLLLGYTLGPKTKTPHTFLSLNYHKEVYKVSFIWKLFLLQSYVKEKKE